MIHLYEHYIDHHGEIQESHDRYCDVCGAECRVQSAECSFDIEAYKMITSEVEVQDVCICCFEKAIDTLPDDCEEVVINKDLEGLRGILQLLGFAKWLAEETIGGLLASPEYYVKRYLTNKQR